MRSSKGPFAPAAAHLSAVSAVPSLNVSLSAVAPTAPMLLLTKLHFRQGGISTSRNVTAPRVRGLFSG